MPVSAMIPFIFICLVCCCISVVSANLLTSYTVCQFNFSSHDLYLISLFTIDVLLSEIHTLCLAQPSLSGPRPL